MNYRVLFSITLLLMLATQLHAQSTWSTNGNAVSNNCFIGETEAMLLGKIEELTLYLLEMHKEYETMRREMAELRKELGR